MSDFFDSHTGNARPLVPGRHWRPYLRDRMLDLALRIGGLKAKNSPAPRGGREKVLIVGIEVPTRASAISAVVSRLVRESRHDVSISIVPMQNRGKFANIDAAIAAAPQPLAAYDWLVIADDDIAFAPGFLDALIDLTAIAGLDIAQPAHAIESHATYAITTRRAGSLVRETGFVEIGPLTLLAAKTFADLIPFPESRWCYGIDVLWSEIAVQKNFRMGIVDGTPVQHLRPVAASYDMDAAIAEGRDLLRQRGVTRTRAELFAKNEVVIPS